MPRKRLVHAPGFALASIAMLVIGIAVATSPLPAWRVRSVEPVTALR